MGRCLERHEEDGSYDGTLWEGTPPLSFLSLFFLFTILFPSLSKINKGRSTKKRERFELQEL